MGGAVVSEQQPQSITEAELAEALAELGVRTGNRDCFFPALAESIFGRVAAHREPGYEPGGIYLSPDGFRYMRLDGPPSGCWMELHANGSTSHRGDGRPERPLRKLVPAPSRDAIYATLANGAARDNVDQLTDRICKLLEGGSDD